MSVDIEYETDQVIQQDALFEFVVSQLGAQVIEPLDGSTAIGRTAGMDVSSIALPDRDSDADEEEMEQRHAAHVGFRRRSLVAFRLSGRATPEERDAAWAQILNLAIELARRYPGEAALVLDFERILMRATASGGVVFDTWEGFAEDPELAAIVARWPQQTLDQPWL
jgi:hypothetical protein